MSLGFLGKKLHTHNLSYTHRLDYAHAGLFLYAQTIAQNPDFFFCFASAFTCCLFSFFSMFLCFQSLCFTCLFAFLLSHVRIRVHLVFALCHDHAFICLCIRPLVLSCYKESKR